MVMQVQAELAEELRSTGLKTTGSKADLVDRLQQHLSSQSTDNAAVSAFDDMSEDRQGTAVGLMTFEERVTLSCMRSLSETRMGAWRGTVSFQLLCQEADEDTGAPPSQQQITGAEEVEREEAVPDSPQEDLDSWTVVSALLLIQPLVQCLLLIDLQMACFQLGQPSPLRSSDCKS